MKKYLFLSAIVLCSCAACRKNTLPPTAEDYFIRRDLYFFIKDKDDNKNLLGNSGKRYNADSIIIKNFNGQKVGRAFHNDSLNQYLCGFRYLYIYAKKEEDIIYFHIDLPFYLYLNYQDIDTIEVKKLPHRAIRFYYNGIFLDSIPALDKNVPTLTIKK